jgi:hypothetical protein
LTADEPGMCVLAGSKIAISFEDCQPVSVAIFEGDGNLRSGNHLDARIRAPRGEVSGVLTGIVV